MGSAIRQNKVPQKFYRRSTQNAQKASMREQLKMLRIVDSLMPIQTRSVRDTRTGIDYKLFDTTIDRKFGFYDKAEDSIKVRIKDGKLINSSDYTLVMHKDRLEIFPTQRIRDYINKHPKRIQFDSDLPKRRKRNGEVLFEQARVTLSDVFKQEKCVPATVSFPLLKIARGEAKLKMKEAGKLQELLNRALARTRLLNQVAKLRLNHPPNHFYQFFSKEKKGLATKPTIKIAKPKLPRLRH